MPRLYDNDSDAELGEINDEQLSRIQESLVEETIDDYSYNISEAAISVLEQGGADRHLIALLRKALGNSTSVEVRYELD